MKGDFSRLRFDKEKHYSNVLMQQGRVQVDADWNEQQYIQQHRFETGTKDIVGLCGTPENDLQLKERNSGFKITLQDTKLYIGEGRYYVDGILCENESDIAYVDQKDFFAEKKEAVDLLLGAGATVGIVYLDVWKHHVTALEDENIREKALGGPDTTTRIKTIWQVKVLPIKEVIVNNATCDTKFDEWDDSYSIHQSTGKLNVQINHQEGEDKPCLLKPETGYSRLENQLYRIEVHISGDRDHATFKWSRDNGSIAASIIKRDETDGKKVIAEFTGNDDVSGFKPDQWVELLDDKMELNEQRGQLIQIDSVESTPNETNIKIKLKTYPDFDISKHPKLRRWDQSGESSDGLSMKSGWITIEGGIEVQFLAGNYKSGDYWMIPARAIGEKGEIEWPTDNKKNFIPQIPLGIRHHFCRLALLKFDGEQWAVEDCRRFFPAVTELTSIFYISGDGQEAMPKEKLPAPLKVGVANGQWPVKGALVRFKIVGGKDGKLTAKKPIRANPYLIVETGSDGVAECEWTLGAFTYSKETDNDPPLQQVEATLVDANLIEKFRIPIFFNANLSVADQVAYFPQDCTNMRATTTVQNAIDKLSDLADMFYAGGDGQEAMPGKYLPEKIKVGVANKCGPINNARVKFEIKEGGGKLRREEDDEPQDSLIIDAGTDGVYECIWQLGDINPDDPEIPPQCVKATLMVDNDVLPVYFNANFSIASQVAYDPKSCSNLAGIKTVQEAIDKFCGNVTIYYVSGDGQEAMPDLIKPDDFVPLLRPLQVRAANGRWPAKEAIIEFNIKHGNGKLKPDGNGIIEQGPDPKKISIPTGEDGVASCYWELDPITQNQQVEAILLDPHGNPIYIPIRFNANLSVASEVAYNPKTCTYLAGAKTVQQAIEKLCPPAIHVAKVSLNEYLFNWGNVPGNDEDKFKEFLKKNYNVEVTHFKKNDDKIIDISDGQQSHSIELNDEKLKATRALLKIGDRIDEFIVEIENDYPKIYSPTTLRNDTNVTLETLAEGIRIECIAENPKEDIIIDKISPATCYVTLDIPFHFDKTLLGFQPLILNVNPHVDGNIILWEPEPTSLNELFNALKERFDKNMPNRLLAHLTLKGNFIWAKNIPELYLDGEISGFNEEDRKNIDVNLPSGNGRRGGDFEMWFWIVKAPTLRSLNIPHSVMGGNKTSGIVALTGPAPENRNVVSLVSDSDKVKVPDEIIFESEEVTETFEIKTSSVIEDKKVTITASLGEANIEAQITLTPPQKEEKKIRKSRLRSKEKED